ncbi:unnamed protein product [Mytilus coruscus]|uniref:C1q domain-containing protein n=1 Tax=Mytilus coruscus TaxID=42192 RepID=A0A6J8CIY6_MYTCO|nr:unnamed protein product [Mytilus coruscus]
MTDNHYDYLLKLFMDERSARLQLQQYVVNQQQQITTLAGLYSRMDNVVNKTMSQTNATVDIVRKYEDLEKKINELQDELNTSKNRTSELEKEVDNLRQSKMHQISDRMEFVGLTAYGTTVEDKPARTILKFPDIKSSYGVSNLTAFINTGKLPFEKQGIYLIIVLATTATRSSTDSGIYICKNDKELSNTIYIGNTDSSYFSINSGSGSLLLQVNVNDTVQVKTSYSKVVHFYGHLSSFSLVKLRYIVILQT